MTLPAPVHERLVAAARADDRAPASLARKLVQIGLLNLSEKKDPQKNG